MPTRSQILARPDASKVLCADGSFNIAQHAQKPAIPITVRGKDGQLHKMLAPALIAGAAPSAGSAETVITPGNPSDYGGTVDLSANGLFPATFAYDGVVQKQVADCYFIATIDALSVTHPEDIRSLMRDTGSGAGRFQMRFTRSGNVTWVGEDGTVDSWFTAQGVGGTVWLPVAQKGYAFFRSGLNTIASLNYGYSGTVLSDLGYGTVLSIGPNDTNVGTSLLSWKTPTADNPNGQPVMMLTLPNGTGNYFPTDHEMPVVSVTPIDGSTDVLVKVWTLWGYDGGKIQDSAPGDGYVEFPLSKAAGDIQLFTTGTGRTFPLTAIGNPPPIVVTPAPAPAPPTNSPTNPPSTPTQSPSAPTPPTPAVPTPPTTPPTPAPSPATPSVPVPPPSPTPEPAMPTNPLSLPASVLAKAAQISGGVFTPYLNAIVFAGVGNITYTLDNTFVAGWYVLSVTCWSAHGGSVPRVRVYVADSMHEVYPQPAPATAPLKLISYFYNLKLISYFYNLRAGQQIRVEGVDAGLRVSSLDLKPIDLGGA